MLDDGSGFGRRKSVRRTAPERASIVAQTYEPGVTVAGGDTSSKEIKVTCVRCLARHFPEGLDRSRKPVTRLEMSYTAPPSPSEKRSILRSRTPCPNNRGNSDCGVSDASAPWFRCAD